MDFSAEQLKMCINQLIILTEIGSENYVAEGRTS